MGYKLDDIEIEHVYEYSEEVSLLGNRRRTLAGKRRSQATGSKRKRVVRTRPMSFESAREVIRKFTNKKGKAVKFSAPPVQGEVLEQHEIVGRAGDPIRIEAESGNGSGQFNPPKFYGNWTRFNRSGASGGVVMTSNVPGDYIEVPFDGIGISLVVSLGSGSIRLLDVYIDGEYKETVSAEGTHLDIATIYSISSLAPGKHVAQFVINENTNNSIYVDAFDVYPNPQVIIDNDGTAPIKPKIFIESQDREISGDFKNKTAESVTENPHIAYGATSSTANLDLSSGSWGEVSQSAYNGLMIPDGNVMSGAVGDDPGEYRFHRFSFDLSGLAGGDIDALKAGLRAPLNFKWRGQSCSYDANGVVDWRTKLLLWDARNGFYENLGDFGPSFSRSSVAYKEDGTQVAENVPRFERGNWGMEFDGSTSEVMLAPNKEPAFEFDNYPGFGYDLIIKPGENNHPTNANYLLAKYRDGTSAGLHVEYRASTGVVNAVLRDGTNAPVLSGVTRVDDGQFHHVLVYVDRVNQKAYLCVDGNIDDEIDISHMGNLDTTSNAPTYLGRRSVNSGSRFSGIIDEVRFWVRGSFDENWARGIVSKKITKAPGLVARWSADEGPEGDGLLKDTAPTINLLSENQANGGEDGTTDGFTSSNSAVLSSSENENWQGSRSIKVEADGSTPLQGVATISDIVGVQSKKYRGVAWVKCPAGVSLRVRLREHGTSDLDSKTFEGTGDWQQVSCTRTFSGSNQLRLEIVTDSAETVTFYVDGLMIHEGDDDIPWVPPKTTPYHGTIVGATYSPDNAFGMPFGHAMKVEIGTTNLVPWDITTWRSSSASAEDLGNDRYRITRTGSNPRRMSPSGTIPVSLGDTVTFSLELIETNYVGSVTPNIQFRSGTAGSDTHLGTTPMPNPGRYSVSHTVTDPELTNVVAWIYLGGGGANGDNIVVARPQVEMRGYATSPTPDTTPRANESHTIHTSGIMLPEEGQINLRYHEDGSTRLRYLLSNNDASGRMFLYRNAGNLIFGYDGDTRATVASVNSVGWHEVVLCWDPSGSRIYFDGVKKGESSVRPTLSGVTSLFVGLNYTGVVQFGDYISELRIRSKAMSDSDIASEFGKPLSEDAHTTYLQDYNGDLSGLYWVDVTKTTNPADYVRSDSGKGKIELIARSLYPSDGVNEVRVETDYVRFDGVHNYLKNPKITRKGRNLLLNGGFEKGTGSLPDGWSINAGSPSWELVHAYQGNRSVRVNSANQFAKEVSIKPGAYYCASAWAKEASPGGVGSVRIAWRDASDVTLSTKTLVQSNPSSDWERFSETVQAPLQAVKARVILRSDDANFVYLDNVQFEPVDSLDAEAGSFVDYPPEELEIETELYHGDLLKVDSDERQVTLYKSDGSEVDLKGSLSQGSSFWDLKADRNNLEIRDHNDSNHRSKVSVKFDYDTRVHIESMPSERELEWAGSGREYSLEITLVEV